jgi:hypothetical protein
MFDFGEYNFVDCYVSTEGEQLFVHVHDHEHTETPYHNPHYSRLAYRDGKRYIVFDVPQQWKHTFQMFREGKYSKFTEKAKAVIIQHSKLNWKVPTDRSGVTLSDARLLAMYREHSLREVLSEELDVDVDLLSGELIAPPKAEEYLDL